MECEDTPKLESVETIETPVTDETIDCVAQQPEGADVNTVAISSDMIGQLETAEDESGLKQQVIIVTSADGSLTAIQEGSEEVEGMEPAAKRFRVEQEDGHTYVLTVSGQEGELTLQQSLDETNENVNDGSETTSEQGKQVLTQNLEPSQETDITQAWFTTRDDKTSLQQRGHSWKQGQWTKDEVDLLQDNIALYCKEHNIGDPTEVIFEMSKDERKDFYRCIAKGLQRPLFSVYRRVIRMYDQKNHVGKYTPEEITRLKELREKHGSDWATIGAALGRSASSVKDRCRLMKDTCNSGKWLPEEERRLSSAVYELAGSQPDENVTSGLSWSLVAEKVGTRSEKQCRTKWLNYLNWKQKGGTEWTREDDISLVNKIAGSGAIDETQVDWLELAKDWPSVRSPQWLRGKWWSMKRHVPDYQLLSLQDIVAYIREVHSQNLRLKSTPQPTSMRLSRVEMPRVSVLQNMTLHVPINLQAGNTGLTSVTGAVEENNPSNTYQAYEVLSGLAPSTQGAYLITQPRNNPAISFTSPNMATDHIIVHTLPVTQMAENIQNGDMAVQMNAQPQVLISAATHPIEGSTAMQLTQAIDHSQQDLQPLTETHHIATETEHITQEELDAQNEINDQGQIITEEDGYETQTIENEGQPLANGNAVTSDLVMVTSTGSPQYVQSSDGELIHMSSLSDPMLPSDGGDLIGSTSDVEAEKVQTNVTDTTPS